MQRARPYADQRKMFWKVKLLSLGEKSKITIFVHSASCPQIFVCNITSVIVSKIKIILKKKILQSRKQQIFLFMKQTLWPAGTRPSFTFLPLSGPGEGWRQEVVGDHRQRCAKEKG